MALTYYVIWVDIVEPIEKDQRCVCIFIYERESTNINDNYCLGSFVFYSLKPINNDQLPLIEVKCRIEKKMAEFMFMFIFKNF